MPIAISPRLRRSLDCSDRPQIPPRAVSRAETFFYSSTTSMSSVASTDTVSPLTSI